MCPVCGSERSVARTIAGVAMRRCRDCGMRTASFGARKGTNYADVDPRAYRDSIARVRRVQGDEIVAFAREYVQGGEWLDVGCGYGFVLESARASGFAVRGLEPDATAARAARERLGASIEQGTLAEGTPAADVVSTLDVIEHLEDVHAFARLIRRKARALWVIKVPSSEGLYFRIAHALRLRGAVRRLWQADYESPHVLYFDRASLTRFLARHGFAVVAARYLDDVPVGTAVDRLTLDGGMPRWRARLALPLFVAVSLLERLRGKSDALVVLAMPVESAT